MSQAFFLAGWAKSFPVAGGRDRQLEDSRFATSAI
jgi:hypothetical protein